MGLNLLYLISDSCRVPVMERSRVGLRKAREQLLPGTSLAALESLSLPLVQEIILSADVQCAVCEKRLAEIMSKLKETESVVVNVLEKKVTLIYRYSSAVKEPSWSRQVAAILYKNHTGKVAFIRQILCSSFSRMQVTDISP